MQCFDLTMHRPSCIESDMSFCDSNLSLQGPKKTSLEEIGEKIDTMCQKLDNYIAVSEARLAMLEDALKPKSKD